MQHPKRCRNASIYIPQFSDWILHDLTIFDQFHPNSLHLNLGGCWWHRWPGDCSAPGGTVCRSFAQPWALDEASCTWPTTETQRCLARDGAKKTEAGWDAHSRRDMYNNYIFIKYNLYIYIGIMYILLYIYVYFTYTHITHTQFL